MARRYLSAVVLLSIAVLLPSPSPAQDDLWKNFEADAGPSRLDRAAVSEAARSAVEALFRAQGQTSVWECDPRTEERQLLNGLIFSGIPIGEGKRAYLVEAGQGCARGGQGANGAMWLVEFRKAGPVLLATPGERFNGWLFSVQPSTSHGYRDVVLGWHMSASEAGLSYFRFDGVRYRQIGSAMADWDAQGRSKVTATPAGR